MTCLRKSIIWYPDFIFVDRSVLGHSVTERVLSRCKEADVFLFDRIQGESDEGLIRRVLVNVTNNSLHEISQIARKSLLLYDNAEVCQQMSAGKVEERRCYNFLEVLPYVGVCRGMCGYCWFNEPVLIPKVNIKFFDRLPHFLGNIARYTSEPVVFTFTHHRTDCFALEHLTDFVRTTADFFENEEQFYIQFLTKSDNVECLLKNPPSRGSIVCFSVNSSIVSDKIELCTSSVQRRLDMARELSQAGMPVLLRIDPMLAVGDWEASYKELIDLIFQRFIPQQITLGTPRFQSLDELWSVITSNLNKETHALMEEQAIQMFASKPGNPYQSGDIRLNYYFKNMPISYPTELRVKLYKNVVDRCRDHNKIIPIGLCEEPVEVWEACDLIWSGNRTRDCTCNFIPAA